MNIEQIKNNLANIEIIQDIWGLDEGLIMEQRELQEMLKVEEVSSEVKAAQKLWEIKQQLKELKKVEDKLTEELKRVAQGKTASFGEYIFLLKSRKGNVQYAHIPELDNVDLELYRGAEIQYFELNKLC